MKRRFVLGKFYKVFGREGVFGISFEVLLCCVDFDEDFGSWVFLILDAPVWLRLFEYPGVLIGKTLRFSSGTATCLSRTYTPPSARKVFMDYHLRGDGSE